MKIKRGINYEITAEDKATKAFRKIEQRLQAVGKKIGVFSAAVGAAGAAAAAGLAVITSRAMENIDTLAKTADRLGLTTEALGGLRHAAELTGVGTEKLDSSLERMTKRLGEAANGTGEARKYLDLMGLDINNLIRLSPDQAFGNIAEAVNSLGSQSEKAAAAAAIFGREGVALVNTMALGKEGLQATAKEAEALGVALNRVDAAKVEAANDAIQRARSAFEGIGQTVAVNLAPYIEEAATQLSTAAKNSDGFKKEIGQAMELGIEGVGNLVYAFSGLNVVWSSLKYDFLTFQEAVWSGLNTLRDATTSFYKFANVGGIFDDELAESQRIQSEQQVILKQIAADRQAALKAGADALDLHDRLNKKLEAFRKSIADASTDTKTLPPPSSPPPPDSPTGLDPDTIAANYQVGLFDLNLGPLSGATESLRLYGDETQRAAESTEELGQKGSETFAILETAVSGWASGFSSQLNDIYWNADTTFNDILKSFGKMLSQMVIQKKIVEPILGGGLDFLGGLFGNAGVSAPAAASVSGSGFSSAVDSSQFSLGVPMPQYHSGGLYLGPSASVRGEGAALLKKGERVFDPDQTRIVDGLARLGRQGGESNININVHEAPGTQANVRRGSGPNDLEIIIETVENRLGQRVAAGHGLAGPIRSRFNLNDARGV